MAYANTEFASKLAPIVDLDDPTFDPFIGDEKANGDTLDIWSIFHALEAEGLVHHREYRRIFSPTPNAVLAPYNLDYYTVFGYDNCAQAILNADVFSNRPLAMTIGTAFGATISGMDAPDHSRYRRIFQKAFLPHMVRQWGEAIVDPVVEDLLDKVSGAGRCDLVKDFTFHYPFQVIYRQLNLPASDIKTFHKLATAQTSFFYAPDKAVEAGEKLGVYFTNMVRARRDDPGDDLVSALSLAEVEGERLPEEIVVSFLRQLTNAAGDTTYRGTSALLTGLLTNPEQLRAVREDRSLVAAAIEEALRWEPPVMTAMRMPTRDIEIDGHTIPKGAWVDFILGSANHDARKYPNPDQFDIFRSRLTRHIAFASGPHVCIGQHLAKVEMERALNAILDRLPALRLDPDMPPPQMRGFRARMPTHLAVRF